MEPERKALEVKAVGEGQVEAVFATLNVVDKDGDVTLPGAFEDGAQTLLGAYGHASWRDALPAGKGTIKEEGERVVLHGQFFMDTTHGKDTFVTVKESGDLLDWSYGYDPLRFNVQPEDLAKWEGARRILEKLKVHEVAPVLIGAGIDTGTLDAKAAIPSVRTAVSTGGWDGPAAEAAIPNDAGESVLRKMFAWVDPGGDADKKASYKFIHHEWRDGPGPANLRACTTGIGVLNGGRGGTSIPDADRKGVYNHLARHLRDGDREPPELRGKSLRFEDEADHVLAHVTSLVHRSESLADLRAKDDRPLGESVKSRLSDTLEELKRSVDHIEALLVEPESEDSEALYRELARFQRLESQFLTGGR